MPRVITAELTSGKSDNSGGNSHFASHDLTLLVLVHTCCNQLTSFI